ERERALVASAVDDRAQSVPDHFDRRSLLLFGDQRYLGGPRIHPRHLPDDADVVDDGLPRLDALLAALVDHHPAREGIAALVEDLGERRGTRNALARVEQAPQLGVLGAQRLDGEDLARNEQVLGLELLVLLLERDL